MRKPAIKIGPWGGTGGSQRDVQQKPSRLVSITIYSGGAIDSISFTYVSGDCEQHLSSGKWGGSGGSPHTISLDPTNYVTEISGTIGDCNGYNVIKSLTIVTLKEGPRTYGHVYGTPFRVPVLDGGKIVGFFGCSNAYLDAIGVYVTP
ncbi:horcolin-like [Hordeum vulgare subsp. vulgare]|uniref:Jacalin-type lectin domain-containing protein n=1 Tax=Hordeum vulgare subsp. vulgare TaxID=112509 RepID=A0A8I6XDE6_HORVV|nr:horcolin-like [Hordeum vulgare subsp. vulgare]KAI5001486.1 hypothetical protein ZWY2020_026136 [Hordeum vulgare]